MTSPTASQNLLKQAIMDCLASIPIFAQLDTDQLNRVSEHMHVLRLEPDGVVFNEGDPGEDICFVVDGTLDVLKLANGQLEQKIAVKAPGGSIGEMAIIGQFPRTATVRARTAATLLTLSRQRFDQICEAHPAIGVKILRAMASLLSQHLRDTSQELLEMLSPCG